MADTNSINKYISTKYSKKLNMIFLCRILQDFCRILLNCKIYHFELSRFGRTILETVLKIYKILKFSTEEKEGVFLVLFFQILTIQNDIFYNSAKFWKSKRVLNLARHTFKSEIKGSPHRKKLHFFWALPKLPLSPPCTQIRQLFRFFRDEKITFFLCSWKLSENDDFDSRKWL